MQSKQDSATMSIPRMTSAFTAYYPVVKLISKGSHRVPSDASRQDKNVFHVVVKVMLKSWSNKQKPRDIVILTETPYDPCQVQMNPRCVRQDPMHA